MFFYGHPAQAEPGRSVSVMFTFSAPLSLCCDCRRHRHGRNAAHAVRIPRPTTDRRADTQRCQDVFRFDDHYELADTRWQHLQTRGFRALPMLAALRCQPPDSNNGEDNAC